MLRSVYSKCQILDHCSHVRKNHASAQLRMSGLAHVQLSSIHTVSGKYFLDSIITSIDRSRWEKALSQYETGIFISILSNTS